MTTADAAGVAPHAGAGPLRAILISAVLVIAAAALLHLAGFDGRAIGAAVATGALVGSASAFAVAAQVTRPLRALARAVSGLSDPGADPAARVMVDGDDEIADLARAVNRLAAEHAKEIAALKDDRDLFASILEGMGEGVLVLDADERIVLMNRALRTVARLGEHTTGKPLIEAIRSAALKEALDSARNDAADAPFVREIELGRPLPRKLLLRVARLGEGGTIAVFHDVTDLRRLETIRTDFVANVSHELRTPITAITTATETLLAGALDDPDEAAEFVGVVDRHGKRLKQLVDDLLDLAKLEAKSFRLVLADLEVAPIAAHAISLLDEQARRKRMSLRIAAGGEGLRARIDRRGLEQVLVNLLDNAVKYAGEGSRVTVTIRAAADRVEIAVADNGQGIAPAHLGRVFERFYRVDAGRSRELGGTGLGLAIVKHLVELMGGTVGVESELGKGSCFTIRLPASPSPSRPSMG
jgi:two-component system, OmpR family, phosphate regulon sensor histidine kinase PhoR